MASQKVAPEVGFEPTIRRGGLTAGRSTTVLLRITGGRTTYIASTSIQAKKAGPPLRDCSAIETLGELLVPLFS